MDRFLLLVFLICPLWITAQEKDNFPPPEQPFEVKVSRAKGEIKVDGVLDESDWEKALITDDFFRREPRQGGDVKYRTEVRFLYDNKNLYIGAFCKDSIGVDGIRIQDLRRDFSWGKMIFSELLLIRKT